MYLEQLSSLQCTFLLIGCLFAGVASQGLAERLVRLAERERASFKMPAVMMVFWALVRLEVRQNRTPSLFLPIHSNKRCNSATLHLNINMILELEASSKLDVRPNTISLHEKEFKRTQNVIQAFFAAF